jgi:hypothetical protein
MNLGLQLLWLISAYGLLYGLRILLVTGFSRLTRWGEAIFNLLLLPGVMVHELSHFFMAAILGVPTGRITIFPHQGEGEKRLGSVEIAKTDPVRESLIGGAPVIVSSLGLVALNRWQWESWTWAKLTQGQFWLWFYAILALSNTMFTSRSDRRAWPFMVGVSLIAAAALYLLNLIRPVEAVVTDWLVRGLTTLNLAFTLTVGVDLVILFCLMMLAKVVKLIHGTR